MFRALPSVLELQQTKQFLLSSGLQSSEQGLVGEHLRIPDKKYLEE